MVQCRVYRYNAECTTVNWYSAECSDTVQGVLVQCRMYRCSVECTGTVQSVLVQYRVYWYSAECTGRVERVLVLCKVYWYSTEFTGTVQSVVVERRLNLCVGECPCKEQSLLVRVPR